MEVSKARKWRACGPAVNFSDRRDGTQRSPLSTPRGDTDDKSGCLGEGSLPLGSGADDAYDEDDMTDASTQKAKSAGPLCVIPRLQSEQKEKKKKENDSNRRKKKTGDVRTSVASLQSFVM